MRLHFITTAHTPTHRNRRQRWHSQTHVHALAHKHSFQSQSHFIEIVSDRIYALSYFSDLSGDNTEIRFKIFTTTTKRKKNRSHSHEDHCIYNVIVIISLASSLDLIVGKRDMDVSFVLFRLPLSQAVSRVFR